MTIDELEAAMTARNMQALTVAYVSLRGEWQASLRPRGGDGWRIATGATIAEGERRLGDGTPTRWIEGHGKPERGGATRGLADADGGDAGAEGLQRGGEQRFVAQDGGSLRNGRPGPTNGFWRDADWLLCRDAKWRPVEPGTFPLAHGAPARVGRLRAYGNGLVAPQATAFVEAAQGILFPAIDLRLSEEDIFS